MSETLKQLMERQNREIENKIMNCVYCRTEDGPDYQGVLALILRVRVETAEYIRDEVVEFFKGGYLGCLKDGLLDKIIAELKGGK